VPQRPALALARSHWGARGGWEALRGVSCGVSPVFCHLSPKGCAHGPRSGRGRDRASAGSGQGPRLCGAGTAPRRAAGSGPQEAAQERTAGPEDSEDGRVEEDLLALVRAHGGVVRRSVLGSRPGVKRALASLIDTGRLRRVSRGVLALPAANPHLVTATVAGGSLTCVSAAAAMDLPLRAAPRAAHIALPANRGSSRSPLVRAA